MAVSVVQIYLCFMEILNTTHLTPKNDTFSQSMKYVIRPMKIKIVHRR